MSDFTTFQKEFKGDIVTSDHPDYAQAIARWAANAQRNAKIVAFVKDARDVGLALKYAQANKLDLAVKCGGHSTVGASSTEGGLVIDLSRYLNKCRVDPVRKLAYVDGGAVWEAVDKAAIEHGLATTAGSVNHTGVAGLLLGGGYGWLAGTHGLTIDNLEQVTMVTADGSVVTANETENPDLFWGVRGGGGNFGILIEAVLRLHPQRRTIFSGFAVFKPDILEKLVEVTQTWWSNLPNPDKEGMHQMFVLGPDGKPGIMILFFFNGSEVEGRANFKAFFDLGPIVDMTKEIPFEGLNGIQNEQLEHGSGRYMKGLFFSTPHLPSIKQAFDRTIELSTPSVVIAFILEFVPQHKVRSVKKDATAFFRRGASNVIVGAMWKDDTEENRKYARESGREIWDIISKGQQEVAGEGKGMAKDENFGYGNYDHDVHLEGEVTSTQGKAENLFGENYPRLQELKKKYDPENIFNKWFAITPAA